MGGREPHLRYGEFLERGTRASPSIIKECWPCVKESFVVRVMVFVFQRRQRFSNRWKSAFSWVFLRQELHTLDRIIRSVNGQDCSCERRSRDSTGSCGQYVPVLLAQSRITHWHSRHVPRGPQVEGTPTSLSSKINKELTFEISFDVGSNGRNLFGPYDVCLSASTRLICCLKGEFVIMMSVLSLLRIKYFLYI